MKSGSMMKIRGDPGLQLLLRRSDLRRPARERTSAPSSSSASCPRSWPRTRTHSMPSGTSRTFPRQRLGEWDDLIYRSPKHFIDRYGIDEVSQVVFRSLERTQPRLLGGRTRSRQLTSSSTITPLRAITSRLAIARRRTLPPPKPPGSSFPDQALRGEQRPHRLRSTHVYANDTAKDVFGTHGKNPARRDGVPRGPQSPRADPGLVPCPNLPLVLERIQRQLRSTRPEVTDCRLHGPVARRHHSPVRRLGA